MAWGGRGRGPEAAPRPVHGPGSGIGSVSRILKILKCQNLSNYFYLDRTLSYKCFILRFEFRNDFKTILIFKSTDFLYKNKSNLSHLLFSNCGLKS